MLPGGRPVALTPRPAAVRQLRHRIVVDHQLVAESGGCDPERDLVVRPG